MKPGDRIAIKASFVQRYGLPFDNRHKHVSGMRIKAIGTITESAEDGKTVKVDWTPLATPKDCYFYTYRTTIVEPDPSDELDRKTTRPNSSHSYPPRMPSSAFHKNQHPT